MSSLDRAVTLEQINGVTLRVRKHLNLHMSGGGQVLFHENTVVGEMLDTLATRGFEHGHEILALVHNAHSLLGHVKKKKEKEK
jgi:hypothetical protein